jgi:hypothetical protein
MLQTIMGEIEEVINTQVIPKFIDWNFDSGSTPSSSSAPDRGAEGRPAGPLQVPGRRRRIHDRRPGDVPGDGDPGREHFGLEVDWEAVVEREEEEARQAELAAQMAMQAGMNPEAGPGGAPRPGGPGGGPAGGPAPMPPGPHGAKINPSNVPEGFVLSASADPAVTLSDMAASLLDDAICST